MSARAAQTRGHSLSRVNMTAVAAEDLVEVTLDGDHQMDVLRDVIARQLRLRIDPDHSADFPRRGLLAARREPGMTVVSGDGAVCDRGYARTTGKRPSWRSNLCPVLEASMRRALGIRRSWRQKAAPFVLLGVVTIPAIVNVALGSGT